MIEIPTVGSFLGCIDLRAACIAIAAFRMVVSIIVLIVLLFVFVILEDETVEASNLAEGDKAAFGLTEFLIAVYIGIAVIIVVINILTTYWFIKGVTSNNPTKMKYYLWVEAAVIVLYVLSLKIGGWIAAIVEAYIWICSNSLYQQCLLSQYNENADNATENTVIKISNIPPPAPPYNSSEENTQQMQTQNRNPFTE